MRLEEVVNNNNTNKEVIIEEVNENDKSEDEESGREEESEKRKEEQQRRLEHFNTNASGDFGRGKRKKLKRKFSFLQKRFENMKDREHRNFARTQEIKGC